MKTILTTFVFLFVMSATHCAQGAQATSKGQLGMSDVVASGTKVIFKDQLQRWIVVDYGSYIALEKEESYTSIRTRHEEKGGGQRVVSSLKVTQWTLSKDNPKKIQNFEKALAGLKEGVNPGKFFAKSFKAADFKAKKVFFRAPYSIIKCPFPEAPPFSEGIENSYDDFDETFQSSEFGVVTSTHKSLSQNKIWKICLFFIAAFLMQGGIET